MSNGACNFSHSSDEDAGHRFAVHRGLEAVQICSALQCFRFTEGLFYFYNKRGCQAIRPPAAGRAFAPYMYSRPERRSVGRIRCAVMARRQLRRPTDAVCFASPIATDAATDRLANHLLVQHKVCRKTKRRTPPPSGKRNTTQQNCCYVSHRNRRDTKFFSSFVSVHSLRRRRFVRVIVFTVLIQQNIIT